MINALFDAILVYEKKKHSMLAILNNLKFGAQIKQHAISMTFYMCAPSLPASSSTLLSLVVLLEPAGWVDREANVGPPLVPWVGRVEEVDAEEGLDVHGGGGR